MPEGYVTTPLSSTDVKRIGSDVTIVATSLMVVRALEAATTLSQEGIEVEVLDPRTLKPLDAKPIVDSVIKTGRLLIVHEACKTGGFGGEIAAVIAESEAFDYLDAPIRRLAGLDIPVPYNRGSGTPHGAPGRRHCRCRATASAGSEVVRWQHPSSCPNSA